jgi:hypothetical protein
MARETRVRNAQSSVKTHAEIPKTPATATRTRDASGRARSKVPIGPNKPAVNTYALNGIFGTGTNPRCKTVTARSVKEHALDTFGTPEKAEHWLHRPNPVFGGKRPRQVLHADPSWVEAELVRIDYGVYV